MSIPNISPQQLRRAADIKDQIDSLTSELAAIVGGASPVASTPTSRRRGMSAEGRRRVAEAARARWAKIRAQKGLPAKSANQTPKRRTMSAAARAKIAAAARARWARVRAAKG